MTFGYLAGRHATSAGPETTRGTPGALGKRSLTQN
jgi:hypothetical protein